MDGCGEGWDDPGPIRARAGASAERGRRHVRECVVLVDGDGGGDRLRVGRVRQRTRGRAGGEGMSELRCIASGICAVLPEMRAAAERIENVGMREVSDDGGAAAVWGATGSGAWARRGDAAAAVAEV